MVNIEIINNIYFNENLNKWIEEVPETGRKRMITKRLYELEDEYCVDYNNEYYAMLNRFDKANTLFEKDHMVRKIKY